MAKSARKPKFRTVYRSVATGEEITKAEAASLSKAEFTKEKVTGAKPRIVTVYRSTETGALISKKKALKLNKSLYTVESMAVGGGGTATSDLQSRTVWRDNATGRLITEAESKERDASTYTIERLPFYEAGYRTVYRHALTGKVINKADALELAKNAYTVEEVPVGPADPSLNGLDVELSGDWGEKPTVSADKGSNDKRGTIRITPGESPRMDNSPAPEFLLTFAKARKAAPFAMVSCWRKQKDGVPVYINMVNSTNYVATGTGLRVTEWGSLVAGAEIVYDYLITE